jgi:hypothetical protein
MSELNILGWMIVQFITWTATIITSAWIAQNLGII